MKSRQRTDQLLRRAVDDGWHLPDAVADTVHKFDTVTRLHSEIAPPPVPSDNDIAARIEAGEPFDQVLADAEAAEAAAARAKRARELLSGRRYQLRSVLGEKLLVDHADEFLAEADRRARELLTDLAEHAALLAEFAPDYQPADIIGQGTSKQRTAAARIAEHTGTLHHILGMYADVVGTCARATKHPAPRALTVAVKPLSGVTVWDDGGPFDHATDVRDLPVAAVVAAAEQHTFRLASIDQLTGKLRGPDRSRRALDGGGDPRQGLGDSIAARLPANPNVPSDMTDDETSKFAAEVYGVGQPAEEKSPDDLAAEVAERVKNDGRRK